MLFFLFSAPGGMLQAARQAPPSNAGSLPRSSAIKSFRGTERQDIYGALNDAIDPSPTILSAFSLRL